MNASTQQGRLAGRIFKWLVRLAVLAIATLLASLWLERRTEVTLPKPTGQFAVGRALYDWTDADTADALAPVTGTKRELLVWIWYPATAGSQAVVDEYLPAAVREGIERSRGGILGLLTRDLSKVHAHSLRNADVSPQQRSYPVLIMRAGASSAVWNYSALAEDLASHGYVVVGLDAPYRTGVVAFPDGRAITQTTENNPELCEEVTDHEEQDKCVNRILAAWTADIAFVLDRLEQLNVSDSSGKFTGRLDTTRVGVFGHSFGGAQAAQFCSEDSRCKAAADVDGALHGSVIQAGIHTPFMFLLSGQGDSSSAEQVRAIMADIQSVYDRLPADGRVQIVIRGANHFLFSDDGAVLKSHMLMRTLRMLGILHIDGRRQVAITAYCLRSFFDAHLKGEGVSRLNISSPVYPELQVLE
jgi:dienelactone hydrolase